LHTSMHSFLLPYCQPRVAGHVVCTSGMPSQLVIALRG
jgi:hypothetical protein